METLAMFLESYKMLREMHPGAPEDDAIGMSTIMTMMNFMPEKDADKLLSQITGGLLAYIIHTARA